MWGLTYAVNVIGLKGNMKNQTFAVMSFMYITVEDNEEFTGEDVDVNYSYDDNELMIIVKGYSTLESVLTTE